MLIQIYGPGCSNCRRLEELARKAAAELRISAEFVKVATINEFIAAGILRTPGLGINGKVVSQGRLLRLEEIKKLLQAAQ